MAGPRAIPKIMVRPKYPIPSPRREAGKMSMTAVLMAPMVMPHRAPWQNRIRAIIIADEAWGYKKYMEEKKSAPAKRTGCLPMVSNA